jgi:hypothetical protein
MSRYVSERLRKLVIARARDACEYCLIAIADTYFGGEIEHIISVKHDGETAAENLAYACQPCNRAKGSDLGSISRSSRQLTRFFNPRTDVWREHFTLQDGMIVPLTEIGEVTARIFDFNHPERVAERQGLQQIGHYPARDV